MRLYNSYNNNPKAEIIDKSEKPNMPIDGIILQVLLMFWTGVETPTMYLGFNKFYRWDIVRVLYWVNSETYNLNRWEECQPN